VFAVQARADWASGDITDIINNVKTILAEVAGDVTNMASEFVQQINALNAEGQTVRETVQDALDFVQHRRTPLLDFVNGSPPNNTGRCGQNTPCENFRLDLENFVLDMANLKSMFPQIEQHGLGDGTILVDIIDTLPPFVLFGFYEILNKVPNWQDTPQNLAALYDEISDADAFSAEPLGASAATAASIASVTPNGASGGQGAFGPPGTKLDIFCSEGKQLRDDPVHLNRVRANWTWLANMLDGIGEAAPDWYDITLAGEGADIPVPVKAFIKTAGKVIESIFASVDAYRANLALCKQIETDVAQRAPLLEYRTAAGNKDAYWAVKGVVQAQGHSSPTADALLSDAGNFYSEDRYKDAYRKICDAYAAL